MTKKKLTIQKQTIYELSEKFVQIQRPIRILNAISWDDSIKIKFLENDKRLPKVSKEYYKNKDLGFDPEQKLIEFDDLQLEIKNKLGSISGLGQLLDRMCSEYKMVVRLLKNMGEPDFVKISQALYGSSSDAFYGGGPTIADLAAILEHTLPLLQQKLSTEADEKKYDSHTAMTILNQRLGSYFNDIDREIVVLSDRIVADASAGAELIKLREDAKFSERDLNLLEVHEGWVHLGTTLNGLSQPICTFLSKGPPSSTITQEGLGVITEIFTFNSYPARLQRLTHRIIAISMAEKGANFLDVYKYFLTHNHNQEESYHLAARIFRGSLPDGVGPFTKDLAYSKGFVLIYNYIRLAIKYGATEQIPLLFLGKTTLQDLPLLADLLEEKIIIKPKYLPPQFKDLAALSSWMSYSLFLNKVDLDKMEMDYKAILRL